MDKTKTQFTAEEMENEKRYNAAMLAAKMLLNQGLIDEQDYKQIDTTFTQKYHPILGSLWDLNPLI